MRRDGLRPTSPSYRSCSAPSRGRTRTRLFTEGNDNPKMLPKAACAGSYWSGVLVEIIRKGATTAMKPWLIMIGMGSALIGLQGAQAQVTIDITKITCN